MLISANHMRARISVAHMRTQENVIHNCFKMWLNDKNQFHPIIPYGVKQRERPFFKLLLRKGEPLHWSHVDECTYTQRRNYSKWVSSPKTDVVITDESWYKAFMVNSDHETLKTKTEAYFEGNTPARGSMGKLARRWFMPWKTKSRKKSAAHWILVYVDVTDPHGLCLKVYDPLKGSGRRNWDLDMLSKEFPKLLKEHPSVPIGRPATLDNEMKIVAFQPANMTNKMQYQCTFKSCTALSMLRMIEKIIKDPSIRGNFWCAEDDQETYRQEYAVAIWKTGFKFKVVDTHGNRIDEPGESIYYPL